MFVQTVNGTAVSVPLRETYHLVVCPFTYRSRRSTHGLLTHLTLVHVSRRLVEIGKRCKIRNHRQHARGIELDMGGNALFNLLFGTRDIHVDLLKRSQVVELAVGEVGHRAHHSGSRGEEVQSGILTSFGDGDVSNLHVQGYLSIALGFQFSQEIRQSFRLCWGSPTDDPPVELNHHGSLAIEIRGKDLRHAVGGQESRDPRDVEVFRHEFTGVRQVVEQPARGPIGCVYGT